LKRPETATLTGRAFGKHGLDSATSYTFSPQHGIERNWLALQLSGGKVFSENDHQRSPLDRPATKRCDCATGSSLKLADDLTGTNSDGASAIKPAKAEL
jgi:hypothetical protein